MYCEITKENCVTPMAMYFCYRPFSVQFLITYLYAMQKLKVMVLSRENTTEERRGSNEFQRSFSVVPGQALEFQIFTKSKLNTYCSGQVYKYFFFLEGGESGTSPPHLPR